MDLLLTGAGPVTSCLLSSLRLVPACEAILAQLVQDRTSDREEGLLCDTWW